MVDFELSACDSEAARLLPWFVTGRLEASEAERWGLVDWCVSSALWSAVWVR